MHLIQLENLKRSFNKAYIMAAKKKCIDLFIVTLYLKYSQIYPGTKNTKYV